MATTLTVRAARARLDEVRRARPDDHASISEATREVAASIAAVAAAVAEDVTVHEYVSTACAHDRHPECDGQCRTCGAPCLCPSFCHGT